MVGESAVYKCITFLSGVSLLMLTLELVILKSRVLMELEEARFGQVFNSRFCLRQLLFRNSTGQRNHLPPQVA
jgi:hypothetical protein